MKFTFKIIYKEFRASLVAQTVNNLPAMQAGIELGSIPRLGRSPGKGMATHSSILAWEIPWAEEPGRLQSMVSQKSQI